MPRSASSLPTRQTTRYNICALKSLRYSIAFFLFCVFCDGVLAQAPAPGQTILVVPFENQSKAPGIEWIGDSFPELLEQRLSSPTLYVLSREDRLRASDRLGIPIVLRPSRATIYRLAEQLDVDYVVLGEYKFDGRTFTTTAQLLDMRRARLLPEMTESGVLPQLIDIQNALCWDVLHSLYPELASNRQEYLAQTIPVRLDAFDSYMRGVLAPNETARIQHFREAVRLNSEYSQALLQLGKAYYRERQYDQAVSWLARVPQNDPRAGEANFYLGVAAFYQGDLSRSESAFSFVASRLPLAELYNNLGVVLDHRDKKAAIAYFQKATADDPNDSDYHFNLGVELYRTGDSAGAARQLHQTLSLKPGDNEAESFLNTIDPRAASTAASGVSTAALKIPSERLRVEYDESSFRQLALKIEAYGEQRLAKADPHTHSQYHADRGRQFLGQGFISEAEQEFSEAVRLNPANADAHAGLAVVLEAKGDQNGARSEADEALRLRPFADPLLVLARLDLRDNRVEAAAEKVDQALRMEPSNPVALALKRAVAAKLAQEAQPLPSR